MQTKPLPLNKKPGRNTALLVIDVQRVLFRKTAPIYNESAFLTNLCTLVERARQAGAPVFLIQHANERLLVPGSDDWQLHPQLQPVATDLHIHKRHGNAFLKTALEKELDARSIGALVVTGLITHGCVQATCLGAIELGYHVILAQDAHSNFSKQAEKVIAESHQKLSAAGVHLQTAAEIQFTARPTKAMQAT